MAIPMSEKSKKELEKAIEKDRKLRAKKEKNVKKNEVMCGMTKKKRLESLIEECRKEGLEEKAEEYWKKLGKLEHRADISPEELQEKTKDMSGKEKIKFMMFLKLTRCAWCGKRLRRNKRKFCCLEHGRKFYSTNNYTYKLNSETLEWEKND